MSPSFKSLSSVSFVLAVSAVALAGCTATGGVAEQMQAAAEEEVALPDSVAAVPGERGEGLVLASYAGGSDPDTVFAPDGRFGPDAVAARSPELDRLIARYANHYEVPERLVRRVVDRESTFNPAARISPQ